MTENRMELFIETLTGTAFELSCSPFEPIVSIKAKIQYLEGIPVSQQHLIWKSEELNDDLCLQDYCITNGATLKLVLGMRGGPINTKQVSSETTKKFKDLADYVERRSEMGSSGGRPLTVLVFHDGDKVRMYTLMERGDCTVSPLSGTISETSSIASIKNVEEVDEDVIRENEITKEKMARLQEQIRALNLNRSRKLYGSSIEIPNSHEKENHAKEKSETVCLLPPLVKTDSLDSFSKHYLSSNQQRVKVPEQSYFSRFTQNGVSACSSPPSDAELLDKECIQIKSKSSNRKTPSRTSNHKANSISSQVLKSSEAEDVASSNFLPYIKTSTVDKRPCRNLASETDVAVNLDSPCLTSIIKYEKAKINEICKHGPITSSQALSSQKFFDLDEWIRNRPKTTPEESLYKPLDNVSGKKPLISKFSHEDRARRKLKHSNKHPLSVSLPSGEKAGIIMQAFHNRRETYDGKSTMAYKNKTSHGHNLSRIGGGTLSNGGIKVGIRSHLCDESQSRDYSDVKNMKITSKANDEKIRPHSGKKLPLIKTKKKSYKRCSLCSKRTGLATSYTCRCGKNFCASHRYAELHHCSYDYKTEGRKMLYLNNPVVAASKLPKI